MRTSCITTLGRRIGALTGSLALSLLLTATSASAYTAVYAFGDSLSDTGNTTSKYVLFPSGTCGGGGLFANPPYVGGACTNGPTWLEVLAAGLGTTAEPGTAGGTNFAVGGATAATDIVGPGLGDTDGDTEDLSDQLARFHGQYSVDPGALYVIMAGGNDIQFTGRGVIPDVGQDTAQDAVDAIMAIALDLAGDGAENFLFANVWDIGSIAAPSLTPTERTAMTELSDEFNTAMTLAVAGFTAGNAFFLDIEAVYDDILADPSAFGITDTTSACVISGAFGDPADLGTACATDPALQDATLYFDEIHPNSVVHAALGAAALSAVPEPSTGLLLGLASMLVASRRLRTAV